MSLAGSLTEVGYAAAWRLVRAMPQRMVAALFRAGADRAAARRGPGVRRLAGNLTCVLGEPAPDDLVRDGMRSYARYWLEAFRLPSHTREQHRDGFRLDGFELLAQAHRAGTGAVVALPHAGNWDAAGAMVTAHGLPLTTVAERLRPEGLYQRFLAYREGLGMNIVPLTGGQPPIQTLVERLGEAHIVPLLADRDLSARGVEVEFFGGRTRMPPGPALLAIRSGAPLYVTSMWYEPDAACAAIEGPLALPDPESAPLDERVRTVTQLIADGLAAGIARHPEDWHMLQRMWLDQRTDGSTTPAEPPATTGTI